MAVYTYARALATALDEAMAADERVVSFGNYFAGLSPEQRHFDELETRRPDRFELPPWSELANAGIAIGAATGGLRPLVDFVTASFVFQAFAQVANEAPNIAHTTRGQTRVPAVFHMIGGLRGGGASQHSHRPQSLFWNTPGLQVAMPATPSDAYGLLRHLLLEADGPSVFITHAKLLGVEEEIEDLEAARLEPGRGRIERDGSDVTIVATSVMVSRAVEAAERMAGEGISCEVLNLRTLVPYDEALVAESVGKTRRVVVADEGHRSAGAAAEILARIIERHFGDLDHAPVRVCTPDSPIPFSPVLEAHLTPTTERIVAAVSEVSGR
ncbi:MAG: alpha-ketoacid dehydrogenase subunit beta [Solirubrobacteraceae bacterium]